MFKWIDLNTEDMMCLYLMAIFQGILLILKGGGVLTVPWGWVLLPSVLVLAFIGLLLLISVIWWGIGRLLGDD